MTITISNEAVQAICQILGPIVSAGAFCIVVRKLYITVKPVFKPKLPIDKSNRKHREKNNLSKSIIYGKKNEVND